VKDFHVRRESSAVSDSTLSLSATSPTAPASSCLSTKGCSAAAEEIGVAAGTSLDNASAANIVSTERVFIKVKRARMLPGLQPGGCDDKQLIAFKEF
jgi:hypothetical protein